MPNDQSLDVLDVFSSGWFRDEQAQKAGQVVIDQMMRNDPREVFRVCYQEVQARTRTLPAIDNYFSGHVNAPETLTYAVAAKSLASDLVVLVKINTQCEQNIPINTVDAAVHLAGAYTTLFMLQTLYTRTLEKTP